MRAIDGSRRGSRAAHGRPRLALAFALGALALLARCDGSRQSSPTLFDLDGAVVRPLAATGTLQVFVFLRSDCPIANRYAPELRRLHARYAPQGVRFWLVYPDADETPEIVRRHLADFQHQSPALRDPEQTLVAWSGATITPEAAVVDRAGRLAYLGRIDDRFVDFGKTRAEPARRDLQEALDALLAGESVEVTRAAAVGCFIDDLR